MFFEATYVPSPPLSVTSIDEDNPIPDIELLNDQTEADIEPSSNKPVDHVIFIIHGIGQQTEQYGRFYEHIENLQETTRQILQAKVPDHNVRIELIPIEWHRHIHEQVDPIISKITLKSIPTIRLIENDYLADVLFYFSKDKGQQIVNNVTRLFNTSWHNFKEKHPDFDGKIIILGYSLGGIITWDILSHQRTDLTQEEQVMYDKMNTIQFDTLDFKPHYFFGLGSPIGAVLTFRGQDPTLYHPDPKIQFENIFHPFDPLGYRFEPLFNDYFTDKPAVLVERSVPIGPSFSFPSMPSFPLSSGFLSFFSWKQEDKSKDTSDEMNLVKDPEPPELTTDLQSPSLDDSHSSGFISNLLQYFSKTNNQEKLLSPDRTQETAILTWDPLRDQTRQQLLALRDGLDRTLSQFPTDPKKLSRRNSTDSGGHLVEVLGIDGKVVDYVKAGSGKAALNETTENTLSETTENTLEETTGNTLSETTPNENTLEETTENTLSETTPTGNTLEETTGNTLSETTPTENTLEETTENTLSETTPTGNTLEETTGNTLSETTPTGNTLEETTGNTLSETTPTGNTLEETAPALSVDTSDKKGNDIWSDLNKELHKPGPGITKPGESKAKVAQDATVNGTIDPEDRKTDGEKEEMEEIEKLPGRHRMDYVLQPESMMSMIANEYLIGLRAHFSYWTNKDFIWHMLRRIEDLDSEGPKLEESSSTKSKTGNRSSIINIDDTNVKKKK